MKKFCKKILKSALTLALCLTIPCTLFLTACGGGNNDNNNNNPHTHDYKTTWSTSATHHWHDCKGEDCTEKSGYAEHSYTNYVCECGYEDPNKPSEPTEPSEPSGPSDPGIVDPSGPHTCDFKTTWSKDATHHWHDCKGEDCTEKSGYAEHSYTNYVCVCGHEDPNKPTEPSNPSNPTANKYADVVAKIEEQMLLIEEIELDVKLIDIDPADGKLTWWAYEGEKFGKYKLTTPLIGTTNAEIIQTLEESDRRTRYTLIHTYSSYYTLKTKSTLINRLAQRFLGKGYKVLAGGLSNTYGDLVDPIIGDYSSFDIDLLVEKDGTIYEYNDYIMARRDHYIDNVRITPYEEVFVAAENVVYKTYSDIVALGNLAKDYYSVSKPQNKYEEITAQIETEMVEHLGFTANSFEVLMIDFDENGKLIWWVDKGTTVVKYRLNEELIGTTNAEIIQTLKGANTASKYSLTYTYSSHGNMTSEDGKHEERCYNLVRRIVGENYFVIYASFSDLKENGYDSDIGNYSTFDVDFLLEKDGVIYEYNGTIKAKRDWVYSNQNMNPFGAVMWGTENVTFKTQSEVKTLGNLAKDFYKA